MTVSDRAAFVRPPYKRGLSLKETLERRSTPVPFSGCIIWLGALRSFRYGELKFKGKYLAAHRAAWIAFKGPIPDDLQVLHKCDVTFCINPDHLFLGTPKDNAQDKEQKGRGNHALGMRHGRHTKPERTSRGEKHYAHLKPEYRQGERNGRAKLTVTDILAIRSSGERTSVLVLRYGVTHTTIKHIRRRKLWKHIP